MPPKSNKPSKKAKRNNKVAKNGSNLVLGPMASMTREYMKTLVDPFTYAGVKIGWGCLCPSSVTTIYFRGTATANADGSLAIIARPAATNSIGIFNGGAAVGITSSVSSTDAAAIDANFGSGRIISMGLKSFPSIAATSAPGISYCGALPGVNYTLISGMTPNDLAAFPVSLQGIASIGCCATGRPQDPNSFIFSNEVVDTGGYTGTVEFPFSVPYNAYLGLPASSVVAYELAINIEGIVKLKTGAVGIGQNMSITKTLADYWPSVEKMWSYVSPQLPPVARSSFDVGNALEGTTTMLARWGFNQMKSGLSQRLIGY